MNTSKYDLSAALDAHVQALSAQSPDADALDAAQRRLDHALAEEQAKTKKTAQRRRIPAKLTMACAGVAALALLGFLLPTLFVNQGVAFAAVQNHLRDFKTLTMTITQRSHGMDMPTIRVWADRKGNAHTDIGDSTTVIVNAGTGTLLVLLHQSHRAMRMPIGAHKAPEETQALSWLKSVRQFQGRAKRLPETRTIDGKTTHGWSLQTAGMHIVLWADNDGVPLAVNVNNGKTLTQRIQVNLDAPIKAERFSTQVPPGYTLAKKD
ncbi:MAG: hypothetical protein ACRER1_01320 [Gammaproteobacteria bacterium]